MSKELVGEAHSIHTEALSQVGAMLKATKRHPPGPDKKDRYQNGTDLLPTLADLTLDKKTSALALALAKIAAEATEGARSFKPQKSAPRGVTRCRP